MLYFWWGGGGNFTLISLRNGRVKEAAKLAAAVHSRGFRRPVTLSRTSFLKHEGKPTLGLSPNGHVVMIRWMGYVAWVIIHLLSVNIVLRPPETRDSRWSIQDPYLWTTSNSLHCLFAISWMVHSFAARTISLTFDFGRIFLQNDTESYFLVATRRTLQQSTGRWERNKKKRYTRWNWVIS